MILVIDNYDSFVHNLARYLRQLGQETLVRRNDALGLAEVRRLRPQAIVLSPGPCTPNESGICQEIVRSMGPSVPVLGVCLGHQAIVAALGGKIVRAARPLHGQASPVRHTGQEIFETVPSPFQVGRYHSLVAQRASLPACLQVDAEAEDDGEIMAVSHQQWPVVGVQFHPESVLTEHGYLLLANFLRMAGVVTGPVPVSCQGQTAETPPSEPYWSSPS